MLPHLTGMPDTRIASTPVLRLVDPRVTSMKIAYSFQDVAGSCSRAGPMAYRNDYKFLPGVSRLHGRRITETQVITLPFGARVDIGLHSNAHPTCGRVRSRSQDRSDYTSGIDRVI